MQKVLKNLIFNSNPKISKGGFYNNYEFIIKNVNSDTQNSANFDENTNYGRSNITLYENYNKKKVIDPNNEYIRKVKNNKIFNELTIFTPLELLHPGNIFKKIIYRGDSDNILENSFILSSPSTIFLLVFFIILIVIAIVFYEYTKPLYGRLREIFIIMIYNIAKIFNSSVDPKYIVSTLLNNVKNQVDNPRPIPMPMK